MPEKVSLFFDDSTVKPQTDAGVKELGSSVDFNKNVFEISGIVATSTVEHGLDHVPLGVNIVFMELAFTDIMQANINDKTLDIIRSNTAAKIRIEIF